MSGFEDYSDHVLKLIFGVYHYGNRNRSNNKSTTWSGIHGGAIMSTTCLYKLIFSTKKRVLGGNTISGWENHTIVFDFK